MRGFAVDFGDNVPQLLTGLLQEKSQKLIYLPSLDEAGLEMIRFCYDNSFVEGEDFEYIINEQSQVFMVRVKNTIFWSFEIAMRTKWKEWHIDTLEEFYEVVKQMRGEGFIKMTASQSAFIMWKLGNKKAGIKSKIYTYDREFPIIEDAAMLEYIDGSYKGAIVKVGAAYLNKDVKTEAAYYDVNSMYSSVMMEEYPIGQPHWFDNMNDATAAGYPLMIMKVHIKKAVVRPDTEAWVGIRNDAYQYDYPDVIENKILYMWYPEYRLFRLSYNVVEYTKNRVLAFKRWTGGFDDYILYWKNKKDEYKQAGDKVRAYAAKIMLNALYGKFGSKYEYTNIVYGNDMKRKYTRKDNPQQFYHAFASYITMKARVKLTDAILSNPGRFMYCDTDAILFKGYREPRGITLHNSEMGAWKLEGKYVRVAIRAPKFMLKTDTEGRIKRTMAGTTEENAYSITYDNILTP